MDPISRDEDDFDGTVQVADDAGARERISERRARSVGADVAVEILRTAAVLQRYYNQIVNRHGVTIQQYNVLRILRGAGDDGLPTLVIRDRMVHDAPGVTRLLDKLEQAGLARRDRSEVDRRQVFCFITPEGKSLLATLDADVARADESAVKHLNQTERLELVALLGAVRRGGSAG